MIASVATAFGKVDVKFNNACVNKRMNLLDPTEGNWYFIMDINGLGALIGMQEAARQMIAPRPRWKDHQYRFDRQPTGVRQCRALLRVEGGGLAGAIVHRRSCPE